MKNDIRTNILIAGFLVMCLLLTAVPVEALDRDSAFRYPVRAYNDGNFRVAIRGFNQFLGEYPDDPRATRIKFWKAESHLQLEEYREAYNILVSIHENNPTFQTKQVLERLAFLAEQLDKQQEMMERFSSQSLEQFPKLQNYLIKWRLNRNQPQELFSELSLIRDNRLTSTAREFLSNYTRNQTVQSVEEQLYRGQWSRGVREELESLPTITRNNLLALGAQSLWDNGSYRTLVSFGAEVPESWQTPEFKLFRAEAAVELSRYEDARQIYRQLLEQPKYRAEVHFSLAWVLYQLGDIPEAREYLEAINWGEVTSSYSAEALRLLADIELQTGTPGEAQETYRAAIELSDDTSFRNQTRYWLAWSYFETGNVRQAHRLFNNVSAEGDIRLTDVFQARGRTALEIGQYEEARRNYQQALKFADDRERKWTLRYELAQTMYEQGEMQSAFDELINLSDQSLPDELTTSVDMALGRTALEVGEHDLSWSIFRNNEQALRRQFPREYLYFSGQAALEVEQLERASTYFDSLLTRYPDSPFGRAAIRMSFRVNLERTDLSDTDQQRRLRQTIEQSPPDMRLSLLEEWGNALLDQEEYSRARSIFDEMLFKATDPGMKGQAIDRIVNLELTRDQVERARSFVDDRLSSMSVHPRAAQGVYRIIRHDYQQRNLDSLKELATRFLDHFDQSPYHGHVYFMLGEVARKADERAEAKGYYTRSLQNNPNEDVSVRANYRLGQLLYEEGDYQRAVEFLESVTGRSPDFVSTNRLRTMIAESYFEIGNIQRAQAMLAAKSELTDFDRLVLGKIHFRKGEISETENYLSEMSPPERSTLRAQKRFLQGRVARQKGNLQRAENIWYETLYLFPEWSDLDQLIFHLIEVLKKRDRPDEAEKLKERLRNDFPDSQYLEEL